MSSMENELKSAIQELLKSRNTEASICPSEAARVVFGKYWRAQMTKVREVANNMAKHNQIEICQKGAVVDPETAKGPIRLRIPRN